MAKPFIRIVKSLSEALSTIESPESQFFIYDCIQLLPNQENAYVQITDYHTGVDLEDWQVTAVSVCGNETDITESFTIFNNFQDTNGQNQIVWQLKNLPDLGFKFVYLRINQLFGETFYTTPFKVSSYRSEFTTRVSYKDKKTDYYESIQLQTWFRQKLNRDELQTYYEISTKNTVNSVIKQSTIEKYKTELFSNENHILVRNVFQSKYVYYDNIRGFLYEAYEVPELEMDENFSEVSYLLSKNYSDILTENPNEMSIISELEEIKAVIRPILEMNTPLVFLRPANEIPPGYIEWLGAEGEMLVGRKEGDATFGTLLNGGGSKTHTITNSNLPKYAPKVYTNSGKPYDTGTTTGDFLAVSKSGTSEVTNYLDTYGSDTPTAVNHLNPYRIVNYIIWNGL